jgi:chromate transporter
LVEQTGHDRVAPGPLRDVALLAVKLGFVAFGGPAAHIAMLRDEVVARRKWVGEQHFLDLLGVTNLIPGPNSTEMVIHVGYERAGWRGLVGAGLGFILPAAGITLVLAWLYVAYGTTVAGERLLAGVKPVVLVVVIDAIWNLARTAVKSIPLGVVGAAVCALYLFGLNELVLLAGGTLVAALLRGARWPGRGAAAVLPPLPGSWLDVSMIVAATEPTVAYGGLRLFLTFLKIGATLYGSGYVLLAFLRNDFVDRLGWLTERQLLDAVAVGQFTPGPVFTTATFVGYVVGGFGGAALATAGIFLPAFIAVAIINPLLPRLRDVPGVRPVLDGVNVSAVGLMAAVGAVLARDAVVDWLSALLAVVAAVLLLRWRVNSALLVAGGALIGLLAGG